MKTNYKSTATLLFLMLGCLFGGSAQRTSDNLFLDRDYWAAKPSIAKIDATIAKGHSVTEANGGGFDATTFAIFANNPLTTIKHLVENGNDVNKKTHDSRTYIFWAASRGNLELMEYFIQKGAKLNLKDSHGYSPSSFAVAGGQTNPKIYELFIANGADLKNEKDHHGANILLVAASRAKDLKFVDFLISKGLDINTTDNEGNGIFNYAAKGGNISILKALEDRGVTTSKNTKTGENAIFFATTGRNNKNGIAVFEYLEGLGLKFDVKTSKGLTPLHNLARSSANIELYDYFIHKGVDVNQVDTNGNNALLNAANRNKLEVITYLVEKTSNINHSNDKGETALTKAVQSNSPEVIGYLLSKKADINILDKKGNSLSYYLINSYNSRNAKDFDPKLKSLVNSGLDLKQVQTGKKTLYHLAIDKNNLELLKKVSKMSLNINAKDQSGNTVLHYAAMNASKTTILKFLLTEGANLKLTTSFEETAYDLAKENELLNEKKIDISFLK